MDVVGKDIDISIAGETVTKTVDRVIIEGGEGGQTATVVFNNRDKIHIPVNVLSAIVGE